MLVTGLINSSHLSTAQTNTTSENKLSHSGTIEESTTKQSDDDDKLINNQPYQVIKKL
jgi:hypothetical protein